MGGFGVVLLAVLLFGVTRIGFGEPLGISIPQANIPGGGTQNQNQQQNNNQQGNIFQRQAGGLSFIVPGLGLLQGNNNGGIGGGGNLFGSVTVTRTVVSTVATVTTASFRTCTTMAANLMPCVPGAPPGGRRKKRSAILPIRQTAFPSMALIYAGTTLVNPYQVTQFLQNHRPGSSIIYPPGARRYLEEQEDSIRDQRAMSMSSDVILEEEPGTTILYPSQDTPEPQQLDIATLEDELAQITTETPTLQDDSSITTSDPLQDQEEPLEEDDDKARRGFGRTTTLTTIIRVTSVATSAATGPSATLTVSYAGCLPQSLPVVGTPCMT